MKFLLSCFISGSFLFNGLCADNSLHPKEEGVHPSSAQLSETAPAGHCCYKHREKENTFRSLAPQKNSSPIALTGSFPQSEPLVAHISLSANRLAVSKAPPWTGTVVLIE